jgi:hypothetical protein
MNAGNQNRYFLSKAPSRMHGGKYSYSLVLVFCFMKNDSGSGNYFIDTDPGCYIKTLVFVG